MSDQRTVATDALATLGTIIDDRAKRDAVHLAVIPAIAGHQLSPGRRVSFHCGVACADGQIYGDAVVGIVDPFLVNDVSKGERFWLVLLPRTIQSLRHVWSHPAFPDADVAVEEAAGNSRSPGPSNWGTDDVPAGILAIRRESEKWLRAFCARSDCPNYERVLAEAADPSDSWEEEYLHFSGVDAHGEIPPEFWVHVEVVLGRPVERKPKYFSCAC